MTKTVTVNGNAQIDTAQSKFGGASGLFDGNGDYLSVEDSDDWAFGTDDFTIDFWVRFNSLDAVNNNDIPGFIGQGGSQTDRNNIAMYGGTVYMFFKDSNTVRGYYSAAWSPSINTWYHLAFVRANSETTKGLIFIDGVKQTVTESTAFGTNSVGNIAQPLTVGDFFDGDYHFYLNGWMDEIRVSKGIARWTANFTPSASAYTSDVYTKLLLHCDGSDASTTFTDSSANLSNLLMMF